MTDQPTAESDDLPLTQLPPGEGADPALSEQQMAEVVAAAHRQVLRDIDKGARLRLMHWLAVIGDGTVLELALDVVLGPLPERMPSDPEWVPFEQRPGLKPLLGGNGWAAYDINAEPIPQVPAEDHDRRMRQTVRDRRRRRLKTVVFWQGVRLEVSTVMLLFDQRYDSALPPLLWETKIFTSSRTGRTCIGGGNLQYASWAAAIHGHAAVVAGLKTLRARTAPARRPPWPSAPGPRNTPTVRLRPKQRGKRQARFA